MKRAAFLIAFLLTAVSCASPARGPSGPQGAASGIRSTTTVAWATAE